MSEDTAINFELEGSLDPGLLPDATTNSDQLDSEPPSVDLDRTLTMSSGSNALEKANNGRRSPYAKQTCRDKDQELENLQKENFDLKLRIYFLEQQTGLNRDNTLKTNINLKVQLQSLQKEFAEKQLTWDKIMTRYDSHIQSLEDQIEANSAKKSSPPRINEEEPRDFAAKEQLSKYECEVAELRKSLADKLEEISKLNSDLDHAHDKHSKELSNVMTQLQLTQEELEQKDVFIQHAEEKHRKEVANLQTRLRRTQEELAEKDRLIQESSEKHVAEVDNLRKQMESLQSQLDVAMQGTDKTPVQSPTNLLTDSFHSLAGDRPSRSQVTTNGNDQSGDELKILRDQHETDTAMLDTTKALVSQLTREKQQLAKYTEELREKMDAIAKENQTLRNNLTIDHSTYYVQPAGEANVDELKKQMATLASELQQSESRVLSLRSRLSSGDQEDREDEFVQDRIGGAMFKQKFMTAARLSQASQLSFLGGVSEPSMMAHSSLDMTTETARRDLQQTMELPSAISQSQQEDLLNISGDLDYPASSTAFIHKMEGQDDCTMMVPTPRKPPTQQSQNQQSAHNNTTVTPIKLMSGSMADRVEKRMISPSRNRYQPSQTAFGSSDPSMAYPTATIIDTIDGTGVLTDEHSLGQYLPTHSRTSSECTDLTSSHTQTEYQDDSRDTLQAATIRPSEAVSSVQTARSAQAGSAEATHHGVELAELQAKLEEALGDCNEARRDARMAREQAKDFLAQVEKAWEEIEEARTETDTVREELLQVQEALTQESRRYSDLLLDCDERAEQHSREMAVMQGECDQLRETLVGAERDCAELRQAKHNLHSQLQTMTDECEKLKNQLASLHTDYKELEAELLEVNAKFLAGEARPNPLAEETMALKSGEYPPPIDASTPFSPNTATTARQSLRPASHQKRPIPQEVLEKEQSAAAQRPLADATIIIEPPSDHSKSVDHPSKLATSRIPVRHNSTGHITAIPSPPARSTATSRVSQRHQNTQTELLANQHQATQTTCSALTNLNCGTQTSCSTLCNLNRGCQTVNSSLTNQDQGTQTVCRLSTNQHKEIQTHCSSVTNQHQETQTLVAESPVIHNQRPCPNTVSDSGSFCSSFSDWPNESPASSKSTNSYQTLTPANVSLGSRKSFANQNLSSQSPANESAGSHRSWTNQNRNVQSPANDSVGNLKSWSSQNRSTQSPANESLGSRGSWPNQNRDTPSPATERPISRGSLSADDQTSEHVDGTEIARSSNSQSDSSTSSHASSVKADTLPPTCQPSKSGCPIYAVSSLLNFNKLKAYNSQCMTTLSELEATVRIGTPDQPKNPGKDGTILLVELLKQNIFKEKEVITEFYIRQLPSSGGPERDSLIRKYKKLEAQNKYLKDRLKELCACTEDYQDLNSRLGEALKVLEASKENLRSRSSSRPRHRPS